MDFYIKLFLLRLTKFFMALFLLSQKFPSLIQRLSTSSSQLTNSTCEYLVYTALLHSVLDTLTITKVFHLKIVCNWAHTQWCKLLAACLSSKGGIQVSSVHSHFLVSVSWLRPLGVISCENLQRTFHGRLMPSSQIVLRNPLPVASPCHKRVVPHFFFARTQSRHPASFTESLGKWTAMPLKAMKLPWRGLQYENSMWLEVINTSQLEGSETKISQERDHTLPSRDPALRPGWTS